MWMKLRDFFPAERNDTEPFIARLIYETELTHGGQLYKDSSGELKSFSRQRAKSNLLQLIAN